MGLERQVARGVLGHPMTVEPLLDGLALVEAEQVDIPVLVAMEVTVTVTALMEAAVRLAVVVAVETLITR